MIKGKQLAATIRGWDLLNENLQPHLGEMPQVQPLLAELEDLIEEARELGNEQEQALSSYRDLIHRRREVERRGEMLRRRVEAHLRGTYGYSSEQLIKFGIKPRPPERSGRRGCSRSLKTDAPFSPGKARSGAVPGLSFPPGPGSASASVPSIPSMSSKSEVGGVGSNAGSLNSVGSDPP